MQKALTKSYAKAAKSLNAKVAPVGEAWQIVHDAKPDLFAKLYQKDGSHPSKHAAYLTAFTIFSTINDADTSTIMWNADLPPEEASSLRQAAATAIVAKS